MRQFVDSVATVYENTKNEPSKRFYVLSEGFIHVENRGSKEQVIAYAQMMFNKCFEKSIIKNKADLYHFLGLAYGQNNHNLEKGLLYLDSSHQILALQHPCEAINQYLNKGTLLANHYYKQYDRAEKIYIEAYEQAQKNQCHSVMVLIMLQLAEDIYDRQNKYVEGIHYKLKAAQLADSFNTEKKIVADVLNRTGVSHYRVNNYDQAIDFWKKAIKIHEDSTVRNRNLVRLYSNTGLAYRKKRNYTEARLFFEKAIQEALFQGDSVWYGIATGNIGDIYWETGRYREALPYLYKDLYFSQKYNELDNTVHTLLYIGKCQKELKNYELATRAYDSALLLFEKKRTYTSERSIRNAMFVDYLFFDGRADIAFAKGELKDAFQWKTKAASLKDSLNTLESTEQLARIQAEYNSAQKENENKELKYQNEIQQVELKTRFWANIGILFVLFLSVTSTIWLYRMYKNKKKTNEQLAETNQQLEKTMLELKQTHAQLIQSEKMASLGLLTAGIAHEINNPINFVYAGIQTLHETLESVWEIIEYYEKVERNPNDAKSMMYLQKLKKDLVFDELKDDLFGIVQDMEVGATRTVEIVKGLKTFSRHDEDSPKLTHLHDNLRVTLVILKTQMKDRITIITDYEPNLPQIECRAGQLNQVFMNILVNAIQAIPNEGTITIQTRLQETGVKISISDTGEGMPESVKKRIFEPFFTTKEVGKGTGLGLAISVGIIEKHFGKISVESEIGKGTTFHIWLPLRQPQQDRNLKN